MQRLQNVLAAVAWGLAPAHLVEAALSPLAVEGCRAVVPKGAAQSHPWLLAGDVYATCHQAGFAATDLAMLCHQTNLVDREL